MSMPLFLERLLDHRHADRTLAFAILLGSALVVFLIVRFVVINILRKGADRSAWKWDDTFFESGAPYYFARMVPFVMIQLGIETVPQLTRRTEERIETISLAFTLFFFLRGVGALLEALQIYAARYARSPVALRGYLQLLRLAIYAIGGILILAVLLDRSPWVLLSGLGAASALLLLIFKDTLLGFVASLQIGSNDMLRLGDWIEMPSAGADGEVIDVGLHTVKVRNWDATITTVPTWKLITESFKNWRGMYEFGGRRIKRTIAIDSSTVSFLEEEAFERLGKIRLLKSYLGTKRREIDVWNTALGEDAQMPANLRRLSNLGTFRAYVDAYLAAHPGVHQEKLRTVRQMPIAADGILLEIYCFTKATDFVGYEGTQSDIFEHLYAILPTFGLSLFQSPAGSDLRRVARPASPSSI